MTTLRSVPFRKPWTIQLLPLGYGEKCGRRRRSASGGEAEPPERWQTLILQQAGRQWHSRVTFCGAIYGIRKVPGRADGSKRRGDLEDLCRRIDFEKLPLLNDTVTEIIITPDQPENVPSQLLPLVNSPKIESEYYRRHEVGLLWVRTREDPRRFPVIENIAPAVYKVQLRGDGTKSYIYKAVEQPADEPRDSSFIEKELQNLEIFRGKDVPIVQLVAAVVSSNPYQTDHLNSDPEKASDKLVLRGFLIEHHPNGTLEKAVDAANSDADPKQWRKWALQIAEALNTLHEKGIAHMDMKPNNVVISKDGNAVLIDISGVGGFTPKWLMPEFTRRATSAAAELQGTKEERFLGVGEDDLRDDAGLSRGGGQGGAGVCDGECHCNFNGINAKIIC
ncbi:hypothetical protein VTI74DRAFT_6414 [Chaetomium olivicolor]